MENKEITFQELNHEPKLAKTLSLDILKQILKKSEIAYYNSIGEPETILEDRVYDYIKDICQTYESPSVSSPSRLPHVPKPIGRLRSLPIWMNSLDKINEGTGQLEAWKTKYPGPYSVSVKLDGASALYCIEEGKSRLFSRGEGNRGQDLSELLQYLDLPEIEDDILIRGELIMRKSLFNEKWSTQYRNSRNAISGLVNKIGSKASSQKETDLNIDFIRDVEFIAYELIRKSKKQKKFSAQFELLEDVFKLVKHQTLDDISDGILSNLLDDYIEELDYEIDGLVVASDNKVYERIPGENPAHIRAFKKVLEALTKISRVVEVEWKASKDGYIKPTVIFEPIDLEGVRIERATGYNAKYIVDNLIGPGSLIEITRSGGVIPKIINFLESSSSGNPRMPNISYKWNESQVDIVFDEESRSDSLSEPNLDGEAQRDIDVKKLHFFLASIGAKGIGEKITGKLYDSGIKTIKDLINMKSVDIRFLGDRMSDKVVLAIAERLPFITLPILMTSSGIFGRGLGLTRFEALIDSIPNLLEVSVVQADDIEGMIDLFSGVEGFSKVYAKQTASRFHKFLEFFKDLNINLKSNENESVFDNKSKFRNIEGKNIVMSGFRDTKISDLIVSLGGKVQSAVNGKTNILILKDSDSTSAKTQTSKEKGVEIITRDEFEKRYF